MSEFLDQSLTDDLNDLEESDFETKSFWNTEHTSIPPTKETKLLQFFNNMYNYKPEKYVKYDQPLFHPGAEESKESTLQFTDDFIYTESPVYIESNLKSSIRNSLTHESLQGIDSYGNNLKADIDNLPQEMIRTLSPWHQTVKNTVGTASKNSVLSTDFNGEKQLFKQFKSTIEHTPLHNTESTNPLTENHFQQTVQNISAQSTNIIEHSLSNTLGTDQNAIQTTLSYTKPESFISTESSTNITDKVTDYSQNVTVESITLNNDQESSSSIMNKLLQNFDNIQQENDTAVGSENSSMLQNIIDNVSTTENITVESTTLSNNKEPSPSIMNTLLRNLHNIQPENNTTFVPKNSSMFQNIDSVRSTEISIESPNVTENIWTMLNNNTQSFETTDSVFTIELTRNAENLTSELATSNNFIDTSIDSSSESLQTTVEGLLTDLYNEVKKHARTDPISNPTETHKDVTYTMTEVSATTTPSQPIIHEQVFQNTTSVLEDTTTATSNTMETLQTTLKHLLTDVPNKIKEQVTTASTPNSTQTTAYTDMTEETPTTTVLETIVDQQMITDFPPRNISSTLQEIVSSTKPYFIKTTQTDSTSFQTRNISDDSTEILQNITEVLTEATAAASNTEETLQTTVKDLLTDFRNNIIEQVTIVSTTNSTDLTTFRDTSYASNEMTPTTELLTTVPQHTITTHLTSSDIPSTVPTVFSSTDTYFTTTTQQFSDTPETSHFMEGTAEVAENIASVFEETTTESVLKDEYFTPTIKNILTDLQNSVQQTTSTKLPKFESRFEDFTDDVDVTEIPQNPSVLNITSEAPIFNTTMVNDPDPMFDEDRWLVYVGVGFVGAVVVLFLLSIFTYLYVRKMKKYSNYRLARTRDTFSSVVSKDP
ncbi:uncharacterized protein [Diabrotica undecimpunctata]|uniref:uncharacterized protein n=1 Tax=Diabrotica undecimpunctata TaxID=50387 RepID=UPI003B635DD1